MALKTLVGRDRELAELDDCLTMAGREEGTVVFVGGEPGIGKTRLLGAIAERARGRGYAVVSGRAYDIEGMPAYLPFIEALREHLHGASDDELEAFAADAPELALLLPEVAARASRLEQLSSLGPDGDRFRLFEAVSKVLLDIPRQAGAVGLVLLLDDVHWADRTSLLLLQHFARKIGQAPVVVLAAYRTTDLPRAHPLHAILADLTRDHLCKQLQVGPLSESDTARLIEQVTAAAAPPELASRLHEEATGNPFFIEEMIRDLRERGSDPSEPSPGIGAIPENIRHVIDRRLGRLSPAACETLQTAAVMGDAFPFAVLSAASTLGPDALTDAIEEADRAGMIREEGDGHAFTHALIRRAVYDELSLPRRWQLHARVAEAMEARAPGGLHSNLAMIAHHWRLGGSPERATGHLLRAGDDALALTAWDEAAKHWEFALQCMEKPGAPAARRARLLEGLGDLYFLSTFEAHPSVERYLRAASLHEGAGDAVSGARARARAGRSLAYPTSGFDYEAALEHLRAAESVLAKEPQSVELGELYAALAHSESHALRQGPEEMLKDMRLLAETAATLEDEFLRDLLGVQALHLEGHYLGLQGRLAEGLELEERACETATAMRDKRGAVGQWPERWHEFLLAYSSDAEPTNANGVGSPHLARTHSRVGLANFTTNCCGWQSLDLNDPVRAREKHERIRDAQGRFITPFLLGDLLLCGDVVELRRLAEAGTTALSTINPDTVILSQVMLAFAEGRWSDFRAGYDQRARRWRDARSDSLVLTTDRSLLRVARVTGDIALVESLAEEALAISLRSGAVKYEFIFRAELALLEGEGGRVEEAEPNLTRCREILAEGEDWRGVRGRLALAEAVVAAASGRGDQADEEFERAVEVFRRLSLPWDEAETFELWGRFGRRFHRGPGRQAFIVEKLGQAREGYERIGAGQPWLDRLEAEAGRLEAAGSHRTADPLPDGLTPREGEVLRLVAAGRSSREIGVDLVLSVRTVERHVANIYLKTGTHGRAQVTTYAVAHGLASAQE